MKLLTFYFAYRKKGIKLQFKGVYKYEKKASLGRQPTRDECKKSIPVQTNWLGILSNKGLNILFRRDNYLPTIGKYDNP